MFKVYILIFLSFTTLFAEDNKESLLLKSDDVLVGTLIEQKLSLKSDFGPLDVGLEKIKEISFKDKAKVVFKNDDVLEAKLLHETLSIQCELGKLKVKISDLKKITRNDLTIRNSKYQWTTKDGLALGISLDSTEASDKGILKIIAQIINETPENIKIIHPHFRQRVLGDYEDLGSSYTIALFARAKEESQRIEEMQSTKIKEIRLKASAKIVLEFDIKLSEEENYESLVDSYSGVELKKEINKVLHLKQNLEGYVPNPGLNSIQLRFKYGARENEILESEIMNWVYSQ